MCYFRSLRPLRQSSLILRIIIPALAFLSISTSPSRAENLEFQINTNKIGDQVLPSIAVDSQGNFVVAWNGGSYMPPPTRTDIFIQRFDRALNFLGPETQVNTNSSGKHVCANVAMTADGRFLVVWAARDPGATGTGVFGRHYDKMGTPLGLEFQINSIAAEQTPIDPAMAMNKSGAFVVTWQASHMFQPGQLYARLYDTNSNPLGSEFVVTPEPQYAGFQPCAEMDADGNALIVWREFEEAVTAGIYGQRYDNIGNPLGTKFQIDALVDSLHSGPDIAMGAEGDFVAVWAARAHGAGHSEIKARMLASTGAPASPEFQVNTSEGGEQMDPAVAISQSGDFVVFWESDTSGTHHWEIFGQRFDSNGGRVLDEFQANSYADGYQLYPAVALSDSLIFIAWQSDGQDGDGWGIFGKGLLRDLASHVNSPEFGQLRLSQNYPNPFNLRTTIELHLPKSMRAKLSIYDVQGKLITHLIDEVLPKGFMKFEWNGQNEDGGAVSSGIYFYRLSAGGHCLTKKMILLK